MEVKKPIYSKTLWANLIMALSALFIPAVNTWMASNVDIVALIFTGVNAVLRLLTKDKIGLSD